MLRRFLGDDHHDAVHEHIARLTVARWTTNVAIRLVAPFLGVMASALGVPLTTMGVAVSVGEFAGLSGPIVGREVERRPRRRAMTFGAVLCGLSAIAIGLSPHIVVFAVAYLLMSIAKGTFDNGMGAWVADHTTFANRGRVSGLTEVSWASASLVGLPVLGIVAGLFSWRAAFVVGGVWVVLAGIHLSRALPVEPARPATTAGVRTRVRIDRTNIGGYLAFGLLSAAGSCLFVTWGSWLSDEFGLSDVSLGLAGIAFGAAELLATVVSASFVDRIGKRRAIGLGAVLMVPGALLLGTLESRAGAIAGLSLFFVGFEFAIVSFVPMTAILQPEAPAVAFGVSSAFGTVMRGVVAIAATRLYSIHGIAGSGTLAAACAVGLLALTTFAVREPAGHSPG